MKHLLSATAMVLASATLAAAEGELQLYNWGNYTSPELLEKFEATFVGEGGRRHSPKASTVLDGLKGFWDKVVS